MKTMITLISLSFALSAMAQESSLIWPMIKIRSDISQVRGQDAYNVRASVEDRPMHLRNGSKKLVMDGASYRRARTLSEAVFKVESGRDRGVDPNTVSFGTAFHVGGNYILTNRHVLSPKHTNTTRCNGLKVTSTAGKTYDCFQVIYCEATPLCTNKSDEPEVAMKESTSCTRTQDMCLIEMKTQKKHPFAAIPSLTLRTARPEASTEAAYSTVGNSNNFGLHFSESRGLRFTSDWRIGVKTQAFPGNSGGPLINDDNEVVGLIYSRNGSTETFAVSMEWVLNRLKEKIGENHPAWQTILLNIK